MDSAPLLIQLEALDKQKHLYTKSRSMLSHEAMSYLLHMQSELHLREIGWGGMDWINLAQDRDQWRAVMNTVMNLQVP
jgi:hypothetical protein